MAPQLHEADDDLAVPLGSLLASVGRVANTRLLPGREALSLVGALARRPRTTGDRLVRLALGYGGILAATPGAVVFRTPVLELIQYTPQTSEVREVPVLMVPPTINKFYVLDLAPGRSAVEHLVQQGQRVFMLSWRNPTARHAGWNLDTYGHAVLEAFDVVRELTQSPTAALLGTCSGGIISSMAAAHLSSVGRGEQLAALTLLVTVLDQAGAGTTNALLDRRRADAASAMSRRKGYLDGSVLAEVFAWLRPNDLIWN